MNRKILPLILSCYLISFHAQAQYCTPSPAMITNGTYIVNLQFGNVVATGITGGISQLSASAGYTNYSGVASGTVHRNCSIGIPYNLSTPNAGFFDVNVRMYADWNGDNDFSDPGELAYDFDFQHYNVGLATGASFFVPSNAVSAVHIRFVVREGGAKASACVGGYIGEAEDYLLNVATNFAPALNASATTFIDPLKQSQTTNEGLPVSQFIASSLPSNTLFTDADPCLADGIAVTNVNTSNGQWQYKIATGAWTGFGAVTVSNALLLSGNVGDNTRIRFVPTGPGSPTFDYRAWDRSSVASNGQYTNITVSGGAAAFGTATKTGTLTTYSNAAVSADVKMYMALTGSADGLYNIKSASLTKATGVLKYPEQVTTDDLNGYGNDIAIDATNNKIVWCGGATYADLMRSDMNGGNVESIVSGQFSYPTGVAIGAGKIFIADYAGGIYSCNPDGTLLTSIIGATVGGTADIEYANSKIWYVSQPVLSPVAGNFFIMQANTNGSGATAVYTTPNTIAGIAVTSTDIYWTEMIAGNGFVKKKNLTSGIVSTVVTESTNYYSDIFIDEANDKLYLVSYGQYTSGSQRIKWMPLSGGGLTTSLELEDPILAVAFTTSGTLPVHFLTVSATRENKNIDVSWKVGTEDNLDHYVVERSADGRSFEVAGTVSATGMATYKWSDVKPLAGSNFYRIRSVDRDASFLYSQTVEVKPLTERSITAYPTIVTNTPLTIKLQDMPAGKYAVTITGMNGQLMYSSDIKHTGGTSSQQITLPSNLSSGIYQLKVVGQGYNYVKAVFR